jgi:hypothetical protein
MEGIVLTVIVFRVVHEYILEIIFAIGSVMLPHVILMTGTVIRRMHQHLILQHSHQLGGPLVNNNKLDFELLDAQYYWYFEVSLDS